MLTYKNYIARVEFDDEADIFHGEIINIRDVITFQGNSVAQLRQAFKDSIEDYLEFCAERHEIPEKPFSGKFNLRLDPSIHQQIYVMAKQLDMSINQWVTLAIQHELHAEH